MSNVKVTYVVNSKKINFYLEETQFRFTDLFGKIEKWLFSDCKEEVCAIKLYWIDGDGDEIGIYTQRDLDIFTNEQKDRKHLFVTPTKSVMSQPNNDAQASTNLNTDTNIPTTANINAQTNAAPTVVHETVECDGCNVAPIIGFRYKCIQCPNYDLCEDCESKHQHPDHMMVRMPNSNCPTVVEAWLSGGRCGKSRRSGRMRCPIVPPAGPAGVFSLNAEKADTNAPTGTKDSKEQSSHHHGRYGHKHHRRHARHGFLANLYDMMTDLAEGGTAVGSYDVNAEGIAAAAAANAAAATAAAANAVAATAAASTLAAEAAAALDLTKTAEFKSASASSTANTAAAEQANSTPTKSGSTTEDTINLGTESAKKATIFEATPQPQPNAETQIPSTSNGQTQNRSNGTNASNATTPVMDINNLIHLIDPQYMKTGIQILNNFSDMFAKMLDPIDGGADLNMSTSSTENSQNATRKSSLASNISAAASSTPNTTKNTSKSADLTCNDSTSAEQTAPAATSTALTNNATTNVTTSIAESSNILNNGGATTSKNDNPENGRSPSEESDWQMIDQDPTGINESFDNVSASTSASTSTSVSTSIDSLYNNAKPKVDISFEKLSKDLKAHIEQEEQRKQKLPVDLNTVTISDLPFDNHTGINATTVTPSLNVDTTINTNVATNITTAANTTANSSSQQFINEEKRAIPVFHSDPRINKSVLAMMSMGFSNEGAWLTQLLESVDGNIAEALDLMNAAQRNGN